MLHMRRRDFITLLGGAAVAWPLAARAQQGERVRRIGVLMSFAASDPDAQLRIGAFDKGMEGRNDRSRWRRERSMGRRDSPHHGFTGHGSFRAQDVHGPLGLY
jgi:putative ABC transport system substrate-binding protein